jgi:hypothetical protein
VHRSGEGRRPLRALLRVRSVVSNQQRKGGATRYEIDVDGLVAFIACQVELVEATTVPEQLAGAAAPPLRAETASPDELRALWLSVGLATHVGLAIFRDPERFIIATHPSPTSPAVALAA